MERYATKTECYATDVERYATDVERYATDVERYATAYRHMASCGLPLVLSSSRHALMIPSRSTSLQAAASAF